MNFFITKKYMLTKVEKRGTNNLYTFQDCNTFQKFKSIGTQTNIDADLKENDIVEVEINIRTKFERSVVKSSKIKFLKVVTSYISEIRKKL